MKLLRAAAALGRWPGKQVPAWAGFPGGPSGGAPGLRKAAPPRTRGSGWTWGPLAAALTAAPGQRELVLPWVDVACGAVWKWKPVGKGGDAFFSRANVVGFVVGVLGVSISRFPGDCYPRFASSLGSPTSLAQMWLQRLLAVVGAKEWCREDSVFLCCVAVAFRCGRLRCEPVPSADWFVSDQTPAGRTPGVAAFRACSWLLQQVR